MAKTSFATWLCVVLLMNNGYTYAAEKEVSRYITVTGEAEVRVVPNEVILTFGLETWDYNLDAAKSLNDSCSKAVIDAAKARGVEDKDIQTDYLTIEPQYWLGYRRAGNFIGYFVRKRLVINIKDVTKFQDVLADTLQKGRTVIPGEKRDERIGSSSAENAQMVLGGAIYVLGVKFRTTELRKYRDEARSLAIKAAREKAITLAAELGQSVGEPTSISENQYNCWEESWWYSPWWGSQGGNQSMSQNVVQSPRGDPGSAGENVSLGEIPVKARISVTFELVGNAPRPEGAAEK
jgi:uncharacterized protein YggE